MTPSVRHQESGQVLVIAIVVLTILAILLPVMIRSTQDESKWTVKQQRTTRAFQLAEAGVERGFQRVIQSSTSWATVLAGGTLSGYDLNTTYSDLAGGVYAVKVSSGPGTQQATIIGVGKSGNSASGYEIRAVKVIFGNSASNAAIYAMGGITLTSNPAVEWGPVLSPAAITTSQAHPRFYSAGNVSYDTNLATPPNSDNKQWWSYYSNLPPPPKVDTQGYKEEAQGLTQYYAGGTYNAVMFNSKNDTCYFDGNTVLKAPAGYLDGGNIIVMGTLEIQGSPGNGSENATLPEDAWKEYGNDWAYYRSEFDGGAPGSFPGVNGTYTHGNITYNINNKLLVHGFLYVRDSITITGGGNLNVYGAMYLGSASSLSGSNVQIYYDDTTTIKTLNVSLVRQSWQETICGWSGTNPTCN